MPRKKNKSAPPAERHQTTVRLTEEEMAPVEADRQALPGIPVSFGAYCKHAVTQYPKLRKLEELVRETCTSDDFDERTAALAIARQAGL